MLTQGSLFKGLQSGNVPSMACCYVGKWYKVSHQILLSTAIVVMVTDLHLLLVKRVFVKEKSYSETPSLTIIFLKVCVPIVFLYL